MITRLVIALAALAGLGAHPAGVAAAASAVPPLDFVPIGDAGNRDTIPEEVPFDDGLAIGSVDYDFHITRSPITVEQWFEFAFAYEPYAGGTGASTFITSWGQGGVGGAPISFIERAAEFPADVGWRYAARFCNWLHNGKLNEPWAFESGVYDTSTFVEDAEGNLLDQREPSPGAKFWIPTLDELTKAAFYDPNRYGSGQGGYWPYPDGGDQPLIPGLPEDGGETEASIEIEPGVYGPTLPVGSYPHVQSPYGLLDISGGEREWTTTWAGDGIRSVMSSNRSTPPDLLFLFDRIDFPEVDSYFAANSFRMATRIPAPGWASASVVSLIILRRRRS